MRAAEPARGLAASLPRLLYAGDVPVESTCHGSALLFRLLQPFPAKDLVIMEGVEGRSALNRRLANVRYGELEPKPARLMQRLGRSRLNPWIRGWYAIKASRNDGLLDQKIAGFKPEAVVTVAHGTSWLAAAAFSERYRLPLHLIVHDDWPTLVQVGRLFRGWAQRRFGEIYRAAKSRLCVSPYMEKAYRERYGVAGTVLYPARSSDLPDFECPPERVKLGGEPFTVGFAGSLFTRDYVRQLKCLAKLLADMGGRLVVYGPYDSRAIARMGLDLPAVRAGGMHPSVELVQKFRSGIDVLFLPMSFAPEDALAMALNFPSKLTDYTAAGLPLLIWGPRESSAVRWADSEPSVAEVVKESDPGALRVSLEKLRKDSELRWRQGSAALGVGRNYFGADRAQRIFQDCLNETRNPDLNLAYAP